MKMIGTFLELLKIQTLEECSKNYVDLVKGYAETIQELFPSFETMQRQKRGKRTTFRELTPKFIKGEYDNEMFVTDVAKEFGKFFFKKIVNFFINKFKKFQKF